jgi:hypothetical protein
MARTRPTLAAAITATIAVGLASRKYPALFPAIFEQYPGDALWAPMVYWLVAFVSPAASVVKVALTALGGLPRAHEHRLPLQYSVVTLPA